MATAIGNGTIERNFRTPREIEVPAPTAWPFVLAFGFTLLFAGLVTSMSVSVLGAVLALAGCVGWFREVFPARARRRLSPVVPEDIRADHRAPRRGTDSGRCRIKCAHGFLSTRIRFRRA